MASALTFDQVGAMTRKVMKRESPMRIWLGGSCWAPRAWRRRDMTMTMRVKQVVMRRMEGARVRTERRRRIWMELESFLGSVVVGMVWVMSGRLTALGSLVVGERVLP